jgi:hypothetical protein
MTPSIVAAISALACLNTRPSLKGKGVDEECISRLKKPTIHWRHSLIPKTPSRPTSSSGLWARDKEADVEKEQPGVLSMYRDTSDVIEITVEKAQRIDLECLEAVSSSILTDHRM